MQLHDDLETAREHVALAVRAGFARTAQLQSPLSELGNGEAIPAGTALQLLDSFGFPASLARGNIAELNRDMVRKIASDQRKRGGGGVPLRFPVIEVLADVPPVHGSEGAPETVQLGGIGETAAVAAFSVDLRRSEVSLVSALPLRRLTLTPSQWDTARANGGVPARAVVGLRQLTVVAGEGGRSALEWQEVEGSQCEFSFVIRPSAVPAAVEVLCGGRPVPLQAGQADGAPLRWEQLSAQPGQPVGEIQLRLQGEDGRPLNLLKDGWEIAVLPPEGREEARTEHLEHLATLNLLRTEERDRGVPLSDVDANIPEFPAVVVIPDASGGGIASVSGVYAPFRVEGGAWEYRVEVRRADGLAEAMPGGGVGVLAVAAQPGPAAQWGLRMLTTLPASEGRAVVLSGEPLALELWLQDSAGNPTGERIVEGCKPDLFVQPGDGAAVQLYVDYAVAECHSAAEFNLSSLGEEHFKCVIQWPPVPDACHVWCPRPHTCCPCMWYNDAAERLIAEAPRLCAVSCLLEQRGACDRVTFAAQVVCRPLLLGHVTQRYGFIHATGSWLRGTTALWAEAGGATRPPIFSGTAAKSCAVSRCRTSAVLLQHCCSMDRVAEIASSCNPRAVQVGWWEVPRNRARDAMPPDGGRRGAPQVQ